MTSVDAIITENTQAIEKVLAEKGLPLDAILNGFSILAKLPPEYLGEGGPVSAYCAEIVRLGRWQALPAERAVEVTKLSKVELYKASTTFQSVMASPKPFVIESVNGTTVISPQYAAILLGYGAGLRS